MSLTGQITQAVPAPNTSFTCVKKHKNDAVKLSRVFSSYHDCTKEFE